MADTRLKAVAPADHRRRSVFAGIRESAKANAICGPAGYSDADYCAAIVSSSTHSVFAHIFAPMRPDSVRAGVGMRTGVPRLRQPSHAGLSRRSHVQALGAPVPAALQGNAAYALCKMSMGADRDPQVVVAH